MKTIKDILGKYKTKKLNKKLPLDTKIITLCGSTKFKNHFDEINELLTLCGYSVFSCGVFGHANNIEITEDYKEMLDNIHFHKIWNSDAIFVIDVNGYIGKSTKNEIKYAKSLDIKVLYLSDFIKQK